MNLFLSPLIIPIIAILFFIASILYFSFSKELRSIRKFLLLQFNVSTFFIGTIFIGFFFHQTYRVLTFTDYFFLLLGIFIIIILITLLIKNKKILINILLFFTVSFNTYFLAEIVLNIIIHNGHFHSLINISDASMGAFNKKCVNPNIIRGYEWTEDSIRIVKIVHGNTVYDNIFKPNNLGYNSQNDFQYKKPDSVFRFIVFGDSYTAAEYLDTPWPDKVQNNFLNKRTDKIFEFFSYALDGTGITNWHSIFFNEIANKTDFDALILAVYADDLYRDFFMMYADNENLYGKYLKKRPATMHEFESFYKANFFPVGKILSDSIIDKNLTEKTYYTDNNLKKFNLHLIMILHSMIQNIEYNYHREKYFRSFYNNSNQVKQNSRKEEIMNLKYKMGTKWLLLEEIITYCKHNNKKVIIASIPHLVLVKENLFRKSKNYSQKELQIISYHFGVTFFDAYPAFESLSSDSLINMYLKNDAHWNQNGSDYFSVIISDFLEKEFKDVTE